LSQISKEIQPITLLSDVKWHNIFLLNRNTQHNISLSKQIANTDSAHSLTTIAESSWCVNWVTDSRHFS